LRAVD